MADYSGFFKNDKLKKKKSWSEEDQKKFREGFTKKKEEPKDGELPENQGFFKKLKKKILE